MDLWQSPTNGCTFRACFLYQQDIVNKNIATGSNFQNWRQIVTPNKLEDDPDVNMRWSEVRVHWDIFSSTSLSHTEWTVISLTNGGMNSDQELIKRIRKIITTWRSITCRIAVTIEGVENAYLPENVHFQYRPQGDIGVAVVAGAIRNASRWLDERITWCPLFGGVFSLMSARKRERICRHHRDVQTVPGIKLTLLTGLNSTQKAYKTMIHREIKW